MKKPGTKLAAWRRFRGFTQNRVVELLAELDDPKLAQTTASLSRIENGEQVYGQRILEALANIYDTDPASLLAHDPFKIAPGQDLLSRLPDPDREQAEAMLAAMVKVAESRPGYRPPDPDDGSDRLRPR